MTDTTQEQSRIDELEELIEQQQELLRQQRERIEAQDDRIAQLEESLNSDADSGPTTSPTPSVFGRRGVLKLAGAIGLLNAGVTPAAADSQGEIGTDADPVSRLYTAELAGPLTDGVTLETLAGSRLAINNGSLDVEAADSLTVTDNGEIVAGGVSNLNLGQGVTASRTGGSEVTIESKGPTPLFNPLAYVAGGTLRALTGEGEVIDYPPSASDVLGLGPATLDISRNGLTDIPYVTSQNNLKIVDREGNSQVINNSGDVVATRLGVGISDDGPQVLAIEKRSIDDGRRLALYPSGLLFLIAGGPLPRAALGYNGRDVIYTFGDSTSAKIVADGEFPDSTRPEPQAKSRPADFDDDGTPEIASYTQSENIELFESGGPERILSTEYNVRPDPMGALDWTDTGIPDVMHVRADTGELAFYDVVNDTSGVVTTPTDPVTPKDGIGVV